ncbi:unnamed protein product [Caenorhabditis bovis]|uniref:Major facilitator superfamily (MFS) profile domain-containing protein n=1 Tax=Caenorhabditis bovis TaxID=2654633 RepID=A0A8S1EUN0_9PELO|nr:unnamed protein product [Caenorhabditis bovis]
MTGVASVVTQRTESSDNDVGTEKQTTDWKAIIIAAIVTFIAAVENTVVGMSEWAYMNEIDKIADPQFFGNATAASKAFHALAAVGFAYWCYKTQSYRVPLVAGRVIAFCACLLYLCVEMVQDGRRYIMATCYIFFGIAASSSTILRAYIAAVSAHQDRPQAYSTSTCAIMLSIVVGPVIQAIFSGMKYPGVEILTNVRLHLYSAPIWVAAFTNFLSVAIILIFLKELPRRTKAKIMKNNKSLLTLQGLKSRVNEIATKNFDWPIIGLCWAMKMITTISVVTLTTLTAIILITNYGWSRQRTVLFTAITMIIVGLLSIGVAVLYFSCNLGKYIQQRFAFLVGIIIFTSMYLFSYPFHFSSNLVAPYNKIDDLGCNPQKYYWCFIEYAPSPYLLLGTITLVMGIGIPLALVALDAIYSKCLGDSDQSIMQGAIIVAEDVILISGPIYVSSVFTFYGLSMVWMINGVVVAVGAFLWLLCFPKLEKYS